MREQELEKALLVLARNLQGEGLDGLKPISASFAQEMAAYAFAVLDGMTVEEAQKHAGGY